MSRAIKENKVRITALEAQLKKDKDNLKKDLKTHDSNNQNDFQALKQKIDQLSLKFNDYDSKLEDCEVKCSNFDIVNMFKDSGDGSVDAAKVMVKALEDKVFKKFEFIDEKNKGKF